MRRVRRGLLRLIARREYDETAQRPHAKNPPDCERELHLNLLANRQRDFD